MTMPGELADQRGRITAQLCAQPSNPQVYDMPAKDQHVTATGADHLPIYESLVRERGDVLAEVRQAVELMQRQRIDPPDWRRLHQPEHHPE
ncbi:hypothetical protein [Streptomyces sp. 7N604]|uniref:hypothetical protein n=1 Tax=Streptomyces sp. 7N604 TaxID=3457415 RepID=UPI003FD22918